MTRAYNLNSDQIQYALERLNWHYGVGDVGSMVIYLDGRIEWQQRPYGMKTENCEILGRGSDEEIKARVHWYITFHSAVFDACSARGWEYPR